MSKPIFYFINAFNKGGAESGLLTLVKGGVFDNKNLFVYSIVKGDGVFVDELISSGVNVKMFSEKRRMNIIDLLFSFFKISIEFFLKKPKFIILSLPQANIIGRLAAIFFSVQVISFEHNTRLANFIYEKLFILTSFRVDLIFADCQTTLSEVKKRFYLNKNKAGICVPLIYFCDFGKKEDCNVIKVVSAGRFTKVKNHISIIKAFEMCLKIQNNIELHMYGDGELLSYCVDYVVKSGIGNRVFFHGYNNNWSRSGGDIFVLASMHEGLSIVTLEAMANGMAVIAPAVGGLCDYGSEENMQFIENNSVDNIFKALMFIIKNDDIRKEKSLNAIRTVQKKYSHSLVIGEYMKIKNFLNNGK